MTTSTGPLPPPFPGASASAGAPSPTAAAATISTAPPASLPTSSSSIDAAAEAAAAIAQAADPARKLVVLLADGLRADTARDYMGYLQALNEAGRAQWRSLRCETPSLRARCTRR